MSLIGEDDKPANTLKESVLNEEERILAYNQINKMMKRLYKEARLVHGDLSEYNILWHQNQCYFIDVTQSVDIGDQLAYQLLQRDCENITDFFNKLRVPGILLPEDLFRTISGVDVEEAEMLLKKDSSVVTYVPSPMTSPVKNVERRKS
ncbi:serine/threonine-protein kinase RIO3-like [Artemia franciscana]|uniref:serine/threonine-protein kinase RIO3-like n=1 Tax=Artemia franciscana TaxID=6661 RepID=UPI0032DAB291